MPASEQYVNSSHEGERIKKVVDIVDSALSLIETLKADQPPDRLHYSFNFPTEFSPSLHLPDIIKDWSEAHPLAFIEVTVVYERDQHMTSISVDFYSDDNNVLSVSRMPDISMGSPDLDVVLNPHHIKTNETTSTNPYLGTTFYKMKNSDLNRLLASMMSDGMAIATAQLTDQDFHYGDRFDVITRALEHRAFFTFQSMEYHLPDEPLTYLGFTEEQGELQTLTLNELSNGLSITMHVDCQEGMEVKFSRSYGDEPSWAPTDPEDSSSFIPTNDELNKFNNVIAAMNESKKWPDNVPLEAIIEHTAGEEAL